MGAQGEQVLIADLDSDRSTALPPPSKGDCLWRLQNSLSVCSGLSVVLLLAGKIHFLLGFIAWVCQHSGRSSLEGRG